MPPQRPGRRFVALLRAVNVGGRVVKMAELVKIFERLGSVDVSTFIASGNVIFASSVVATSALEARIEAELQKALGYNVAVMVRTTAEMAAAAQYQAFTRAELGTSALYVGFMKTRPATAAVKRVLALQTPIDELHAHGGEIYWLARKRIAESSISGGAIEKALQMPVTFRNITTVTKLTAKYGD